MKHCEGQFDGMNGMKNIDRGDYTVPDEDRYDLRLYVAGHSDRSVRAISNLKRICEEHLTGRYSIEIIDLTVQPQLAVGDQIMALPTLVRRLPPPLKKVIGDLSNEERVLVGLDVRHYRD